METKPLSRDTRRFHRKSRNGCMQCKQRHVKCDENKPSCSNCVQTSRACSFLRMMPTIPVSLVTSTTKISSGSSSSNAASPALGAKISGPPTPSSTTPSSSATTTPVPLSFDARLFSQYTQSPEFSLADLSMLHVFTTSTSLSLTSSPEVQHVWATTVVQIAMQHRFLLHGLLAVSALHIAYTCSKSEDNRQLIDYGTRHQTIALSLYQHALTNPRPGQQEALFVLSVLIFMLAIATSREDNLKISGAGGADIMVDCKWIRLARGIIVVNQDHIEEISRGPLGLLMQKEIPLHPEQRKDENLPYDLKYLQRLWHTENMSPPSPGSVTDFGTRHDMSMTKAERQAYDDAYLALLTTYSRVTEHMGHLESDAAESVSGYHGHHGPPHITIDPRRQDRIRGEMFMWIIQVPEHYIELLEQHKPIALIILTHYAALLSRDCYAWWTGQSAHAIISRVWAFLDEKSRKWIETPMAEVRRADG